MTMAERIRQMTDEELQDFIYWVYVNGNRDGMQGFKDSPNCSFFGEMMLKTNAEELMPTNHVGDLWNLYEELSK